MLGMCKCLHGRMKNKPAYGLGEIRNLAVATSLSDQVGNGGQQVECSKTAITPGRHTNGSAGGWRATAVVAVLCVMQTEGVPGDRVVIGDSAHPRLKLVRARGSAAKGDGRRIRVVSHEETTQAAAALLVPRGAASACERRRSAWQDAPGDRRRAAGSRDQLTPKVDLTSFPSTTSAHVQRLSPPLLRRLAALARRHEECRRHGQEGPLLPVVSPLGAGPCVPHRPG